MKNVTRKDIAEKLGVSVSVVSRVINNSGYVSKEKREKVLKAAKEMGYVQNPVAMALQQNKTKQLLFFCEDLTATYYNQMYHGMVRAAKERGYHVYLLSNYPRDIFTLHAGNGSFPFLDYVDGKVVSGFVQMIKPDTDIYKCLMDKYTLKPEECIFIDDREENIQGAINVGMQGIVFQNFIQASSELDRKLA